MSMNVDFQYPRQAEDVESVKNAVRSFDKEMRKMMLLMKDVGNTLEGVSTSFSALTCLNMQDSKDIRGYVDNFREQVVKMKEGAPFQNYNRLVHEEVLVPVNELKTAIKETEAAMAKRGKTYGMYTKVKKRVDKTERTYAQKSKPLEGSKSYVKDKAAREKNLAAFHETDRQFQVTFTEFVKKVEAVTQSAMHRYLELNAGYMTSVIEALTNTDPSIEEHVELYRRQLYADRSSEIAQRKREVERQVEESLSRPQSGGAAVAGQGYDYNSRLHSARNGGVVADTPTKPSADPSPQKQQTGAATKLASTVGSNPAVEDSVTRVRAELQQGEGVRPAVSGPPAAAMQSDDASPDTQPNRAVPDTSPAPDEGKAAAAAEVEKRMNEVASRVHPEPEPGNTIFEDYDDGDGGESYFGSVSQINEAQQLQQQRLRAAALSAESVKPLYRFAASTVAGASSAPGGYMAAQDNAINEKFMQGLKKEDES